MKLLNDFAIAIAHPKRYKELIQNKLWRVLLYALVIIAIGSVSVIISATQLKGIMGTFYEKSVPDFTFTDNTLNMSEPFELNIGGILIKADSSREFASADMGSAKYGYLFGKNTMVIRSGRNTIESKYTDLKLEDGFTMSKSTLSSYSFLAEKLFRIFCVFLIIAAILGFFFGALIIALLALIPNRNAGLSFGTLFKFAIYSRGLPIILSLILARFIGGIPTIISLMLSFILVNIALMTIVRDDFLKKHGDVSITYDDFKKFFENENDQNSDNNDNN